MKLENLLDSTKFNIAVGRMIERMYQATENGLDWGSIDDDSIDFDADDNVTVSIELVPAWATLENIDTDSALDLYNEYNDTDFSSFEDVQANPYADTDVKIRTLEYDFSSFEDVQANPYADMDVKIRTLDYDTMTDETLQVYYLDSEDCQKVNSLF